MSFAYFRVGAFDRPVFHFRVAEGRVQFGDFVLKVADGQREALDFLDRVSDLPRGPFQLAPQTAQFGRERCVRRRGAPTRPSPTGRRFRRLGGLGPPAATGCARFYDLAVSRST